LKWAAGQFADLAGYGKHSPVLQSPGQFYSAMLKKLVPGLFPQTIALALKGGHVIPVQEFMTLFIYKEIFVDRCYDVMIDRTDPLIVDIGANTGLFALRMKQLFPASNIACYEPFPSNHEQLERTIRINHLESVVLLQKAVAARAGRAKLYIHKRNVGGHSLYSDQASSNKYLDVEVVEFGAIVEALPRPIDLLKVDCEGAEFEILTALTDRLADKVRQVIVEPMPRLYDVKALVRHMNSLGYSHQWRDGLYLFSRT
jgi:FkbM family methyltransferase